MLGLGILFENLFRLFDFFGRVFIVAEITGQVLLIRSKIDHTMAAEIEQYHFFLALFLGFFGQIDDTGQRVVGFRC